MTSPPGDDPPQLPPPDFVLSPGREKAPHASGWRAPEPDPELPSPGEPESVFTPRPGAPVASQHAPPPPPPRLAWDSPPPPPVPPPLYGAPSEGYPTRYDVQYPDRLSRLSTFFRLFLLLPAYLIVALVWWLLWVAMMLGWTTVFWRRKYPPWLFQATAGALDYTARFAAYALLQTDRFPGFAREDSAVTLDFDEPPSGQLSRWRVFWWKLALILPHYVALWFLQLALFAVTVLAWFGILFTGNYPRGLFAFATGVTRWHFRVWSYFASFNDRFPPYALSPTAGPAGNGAAVASGIAGGLVLGIFAAISVVGALLGDDTYEDNVDYALLKQGRDSSVVRFENEFESDAFTVTLTLTRVTDPGEELVQILDPGSTERIVVFEWTARNTAGDAQQVPRRGARLTFTTGAGGDETSTRTAEVVTVSGRSAPVSIAGRGSALIQAAFVIPREAEPVSLRFEGGFAGRGGVLYRFE